MDYLTLINNYGNDLQEYQKPIARKLFNDLLKRGWTYEKIYWGIRLLRGRPIEKYTRLFYYRDFIEEIEEQVEFAQDMINVSYEEKVKTLNIMCGYGQNSIPEEYKDDFYKLDDKIWNSGGIYTKEQLEDEVNYIYEKCYLMPCFSVPLEEI